MRLVALVVLALAAAGCSGGRETTDRQRPHQQPPARHYTDPAGWSISYPPALKLEHSDATFRLYWTEVTLATFEPVSPIHTHSSATSFSARVSSPADASGDFPPDGAALRIFRSEGGPFPSLEVPETHLPIHVADLEAAQVDRGPVPAFETRIEANGQSYTAGVWLGPEATDETRALIDDALASMRFPQLRPGQSVGHGFSVLERPSAYPLGSVTRVELQGSPFYVVHAPGGFYAIGWTAATLSGGYKSGCDVIYRPASQTFAYPRLGATWDRIGRVLERPAGATVDDPLNMTIGKVSQDGHLLVPPGMAMFAGRDQAKRYWPGWTGG